MIATPTDPDFVKRVRMSFERQAAMATIGAVLTRVEPGEVDLELPFRQDLTQQHGFLHAGIVASVMDTACGYAAFTLMDPGTSVLSVEFKVNLLKPARGTSFRATGRVVRAGRTVTVVSGEFRLSDDASSGPGGDPIAIMTATMMTMRDRPDLSA
jgi:uncharacterized protein (TIGR00369 family)